MHTEMSTPARELAAAAYGASCGMDFPIGDVAAELAAAHVTEPEGLLRVGKAVAAAIYAEADEDVHDEELIDEREALTLYYENVVGDDSEPDPDLELEPWASYTREQILTAVYLLVTQRAEADPPPYGGSDDTLLLGSLGEHLERELGGLGNVDPLDLADELAEEVAR